MALFYKRPLACACTCFVIATLLSFLLPSLLSFCLACLFLLPTLVLFVICLVRGFSYRKLFLLLLLAALALSLLRTAFDVGLREEKLDRYHGRTVTAELAVTDVLYQNAYGAELLAKASYIDAQEEDLVVVLRFSASTPFLVGDRIKGDFAVKALHEESYREGSENQYLAEGAKLLLVCEDTATLSLVESGTHTLSAKLFRLRAIVAFRIFDTVGGEEGKLLSAMLLGTRDSLSDATVRDFQLSGVSHLLALSGLHLMILVGLLDRLLLLCRASKRTRIAIVIPLCLLYFILTGCNYSLLRAMVMLGAVYLSFLLGEQNDSLTILFLCAAIILSVTPYAVFSVSFQMTMLATLGILAFSKIHAKLGRLFPFKKGWRGLPILCLRAILTSLLITLTTSLSLLPVMWLTFGYYALMTPLANLVLVPLAPALLFCAILPLLLPFSAVGAASALVAKVALAICRFFASFDLLLSLTQNYVPYILIPLFASSAVLLFLDLKRRYWICLIPSLAAILAFSIVTPIFFGMGRTELHAIYRRDGNNEGIVLVQNESAVICDVSASSLTQWRADWDTAKKAGATRLEVLMLTHYHSKSVSALTRFSQSVRIHALWLPQPQTAQEREVLAQLLELAARHSLTVTIYEHEQALTVFGDGTIHVQTPLFYSRSSEPAFGFSLSFASKTLCYHTAALSEYLRGQNKAHDCQATDLILGAHGPVPHDTVQIPSSGNISTVLVGNEKVLSFLEMRQNLSYYAFPKEIEYVLK